MRTFFIIISLFLLSGVWTTGAWTTESWAADTQPESIMSEISNTYMSPYCPGRTISSCPSPSARELREEILDWAKDGSGQEEIVSKLEERFGEGIYSSPTSGVGKILKYFPVLIVLTGLVLYFTKISKLKSNNYPKEEGKPNNFKESDFKKSVDEILKDRFT